MNVKTQTIYTAIMIGDKKVTDNLEKCIKFTCTNIASLSRVVDIDTYHLEHYFCRLRKTVHFENEFLMIKTTILYTGNQKPPVNGFNRNG